MNTETREALRPNRALTDPMEFAPTETRGALIPSNAGEAMELAKIMATGKFSVPLFLQHNPGDCLRIVMISARTGLDPFLLATESYVVPGKGGEQGMAFMAKAVHAITLASGVLDGDLKVKIEGEGQAMKCTVTGKRKGGSVHQETYALATITTKNSPLWKDQPRQQLIYYAERAWCRAHAPDALMGLIAREDPPLRDMTDSPTPPAATTALDKVNAVMGGTVDAEFEEVAGAPESPQEPQEPEPPSDAAEPEEAVQAPAQATEMGEFERDMRDFIAACRSPKEVDDLMGRHDSDLARQSAAVRRALDNVAAMRRAELGAGK